VQVMGLAGQYSTWVDCFMYLINNMCLILFLNKHIICKKDITSNSRRKYSLVVDVCKDDRGTGVNHGSTGAAVGVAVSNNGSGESLVTSSWRE
jgi:hypothetical protein